MKSILVICVLLFAWTAGHPQNALNTKEADTDLALRYKQKSVNGKATGFGVLGIGVGLIAVGYASAMENILVRNRGAENLVITGFGMALSSIPIFIIASKNKRKSAILFRQEEKIWKQQKNSTAIVWRLTF